MMQLTYLYNSGFLLETEHANILFDYYRKGHDIIRRLLESPLPLYVLVSHSHPDHFNPDCLGWLSRHRDTHYIFSDELRPITTQHASHITYLSVGEQYRDENITVEAFGSTDIGCSFYLTIGTFTLFHAGDLNNWHWQEESTPKEVVAAELIYLAELQSIATAHPQVDLALFPVDGRMGRDYDRGARQFLQAITTRIFVPMHYWSHPDRAALFAETAQQYGARFIMMHKTGECYSLTGRTQ